MPDFYLTLDETALLKEQQQRKKQEQEQEQEQKQEQEQEQEQRQLALSNSRKLRGYDQFLKVIAIGSSGVGKTALLTRYVNDRFLYTNQPTIGVDSLHKCVLVPDGRLIKAQYWDSAGQERFRAVTSNFFRHCQAVLLVYNVTDSESFKEIESVWVPALKSKFLRNGNEELNQAVSMILVGNQSDCDSDKRKVSFGEGEALALKLGVKFYETSAKDNVNVEKAMGELVEDTMNRIYPYPLWLKNQLKPINVELENSLENHSEFKSLAKLIGMEQAEESSCCY